MTKQYRLVVFAPKHAAASIRTTALANGADALGTYRYHSFSVKGVGSFISTDGAHPVAGVVGGESVSDEVRLEFSVAGRSLPSVTEAIRQVHPDQNPVIDSYPLYSL
jgi:hypothetical protein